jgi:two-component system response regulator ChvI
MNLPNASSSGARASAAVPQDVPGSREARLRTQVLLVDDDDMFRESLGQNLVDEEFDVVDFCNGQDALQYLAGGAHCDVVLLDWNMPRMSGFEVLRELGVGKLQAPVVILTAFSDEQNEAVALDCGAVDFLDKSRSPSILARRLRIILRTGRGLHVEREDPEVLRIGCLELKLRASRAFWSDVRVPLTITEFNIVCLLASRAGEEVSYREIYDVVHGSDFVAGDGPSGYRTNVRSLIKRIRQKFRELDENFQEIENYPGFGYSWRAAGGDPVARRDDASEDGTALDADPEENPNLVRRALDLLEGLLMGGRAATARVAAGCRRLTEGKVERARWDRPIAPETGAAPADARAPAMAARSDGSNPAPDVDPPRLDHVSQVQDTA